MKNILFLTDFSENSWKALKYGLNFFVETNCNFYILHVNNNIIDFQKEDTLSQFDQETIEDLYTKPTKKKLKEILKRISKEIPHNKKHKFYILTNYGFFIESVRKHVLEKKISLIIMGTQGATGLKKYIVGSNTGDVITKVKCSTLVVPENATYSAPKEIAFPTDFAISYDIQVLQPILDILKSNNSCLRVLHIGHKEKQLNADQKACKELIGDFFDGFDYSYHYLTNKKVEDGIQCFVESRNIDIIVMVAKNLNYFQQILFHTKTEQISYHTDIPFLVLHE
ncbi:universal stress protein [Tenacibaculum caenipelagi]|uniref:Nucleotide-binding universal stress UspA family protein n=1 Tax=Tenacibaculum caenipelagi TaxID=1325435 RepID=A0A4R6TC71_9FLAO|nr:universal stress protein [Tenacibaculum caenipelagi]TDQ21956.1 nucleotide-binding universal stress UspA family protein [Tenacibaculum caenipelagi]